MHTISFIQDLAVIMLIAGSVTVIFHRLRQPVVLGYIVAGAIIGPHTPPFSLVSDQQTIKTLAEMGVVFLMFSLGLEFSLRKLAKVGLSAAVAAIFEIVMMGWIGFEIGQGLGWSRMNSLYLGAILAMSSTTIIIRVLDDLDLKNQPFARLAFGILIVEDILGVAMIALLSALASTGTMEPGPALLVLGKLLLFMTVAAVLGFLTVPRILDYVAGFHSGEMLLITVVGILFGFCLLVMKLNYSVALGAFIIGAVMAEARQLKDIEALISPVKDMFSAIFFVTIGMMLDFRVMAQYAIPIALIVLALLIGKTVSCTAGAFISGTDGRTSVRAGLSLAQIGEFSFIIASLGLSLGVTSRFLYPIAVATSVITTFMTPYLIRSSDRISAGLRSVLPPSLARVLAVYSTWIRSVRSSTPRAGLGPVFRRSMAQISINMAFVVAVFLAGAYAAGRVGFVMPARWRNTAVWAACLAASLPFLIAAYRKLQAISMVLAEMAIKPGHAARYDVQVRRIVSEVIPVAFLAGMLMLVLALSSAVLPPVDLLAMVLLCGLGLGLLLWRRLAKIHSRLQAALMDTFKQQDGF